MRRSPNNLQVDSKELPRRSKIRKRHNSSAFSWLLRARNLLFPAFDEINYTILFWCTFVLLLFDPTPLIEALDEDARMFIFIGAAIYLLVRVLGRGKLGSEAKIWIVALYYGFLAWLSCSSVLLQFEQPPLIGPLQLVNFAVAIVVLVVSAIRLLTTLIIFRLNNPTYERLLTDRFRDRQGSWLEFCLVLAAATVAVWVAQFQSTAGETVLLLSYAYTAALHGLVSPYLSRFAR